MSDYHLIRPTYKSYMTQGGKMKVQTEGMSQKQAESNASKNRSETCKDWYHWKADLTVHDDEMICKSVGKRK